MWRSCSRRRARSAPISLRWNRCAADAPRPFGLGVFVGGRSVRATSTRDRLRSERRAPTPRTAAHQGRSQTNAARVNGDRPRYRVGICGVFSLRISLKPQPCGLLQCLRAGDPGGRAVAVRVSPSYLSVCACLVTNRMRPRPDRGPPGNAVKLSPGWSEARYSNHATIPWERIRVDCGSYALFGRRDAGAPGAILRARKSRRERYALRNASERTVPSPGALASRRPAN